MFKYLLTLSFFLFLPAFGDLLFLNHRGDDNLDEIKKRLNAAGVSLLKVPSEYPSSSKYYFHGSIIAIRKPQKIAKTNVTPETSCTYKIKPITREGKPVFSTVEIPECWLAPSLFIDSFLDLRFICSNRDKLLHTKIGSGTYNQSFLNSLDPEGELKLKSESTRNIPQDKLREGGLQLKLRKISKTPASRVPIFVKENELGKISKRYTEYIENGHSILWIRYRSPAAASFGDLTRTHTYQWLHTIAAQRKYRCYESGIDRSMLSLLSAKIRLAEVKTGSNYSYYVRQYGRAVRKSVIFDITTIFVEDKEHFKEGKLSLLLFPIPASVRLSVALDLLLANPSLHSELQSKEESIKILQKKKYSPRYIKPDFTNGIGLIPRDLEAFKAPLSNTHIDLTKMTQAEKVYPRTLVDLLQLTKEELQGEQIDIRQKVVTALSQVVSGKFDVRNQELKEALELAQVEVLTELYEMIRGVKSIGRGHSKIIILTDEKKKEIYRTWTTLLGILESNKFPGRFKAVSKLAEEIYRTVRNNAELKIKDDKEGRKSDIEEFVVRMGVKMLKDLEQLTGNDEKSLALRQSVQKLKTDLFNLKNPSHAQKLIQAAFNSEKL